METGNVSNNNEPSFQLNFTKYPNRQPISALYKSGTLKSYIGKSSTLNQYVGDTLTLENAILSISTSKMKKFLKTRKGEVLMVETNSSIDMKVTDESPLQPLYTTINWTEVGDASNISVVSEPTDEFFPIITSYTYSDELSGSLVTFSTENGGLPFKYLLLDLQPIQDLHGYDHPWPGGGGKNLYDVSQVTAKPSSATVVLDDGKVTLSGLAAYTGLGSNQTITIRAGVTYTVSAHIKAIARSSTGTNPSLGFRRVSNNSFIASSNLPAGVDEADVFRTYTPDEDVDIYVSGVIIGAAASETEAVAEYTNIQLEVGSEATSWEPYSNICPISGRTGANAYVSPSQDVADATVYNVTFGEAGTVYAGSVDVVSGKLLTRPYYASYNGETLVGPWVSSVDEYAPGATPTTGAQVVDLGGVETETQLTAQEVATLVGQNNVWSDSGDVTVRL